VQDKSCINSGRHQGAKASIIHPLVIHQECKGAVCGLFKGSHNRVNCTRLSEKKKKIGHAGGSHVVSLGVGL
jgi:hypothetical protein